MDRYGEATSSYPQPARNMVDDKDSSTVTQKALGLLQQARRIADNADSVRSRVITPRPEKEMPPGVAPDPQHLVFILEETQQVLDRIANAVDCINEAL